MWSTLLWANVLHGLVALAWATGLRRIASPASPALVVTLLSLCLLVPFGVGAAHGLGFAPAETGFTIVRVERWIGVAREADLPARALALTLLVGTTLLFITQELVPALTGSAAWRSSARASDPRLDASLGRVVHAYLESGALPRGVPPPDGELLETDAPVATLSGLLRHRILVSRGLLSRVDDAELDAVLAHEMAHFVRGGNRRLLTLWLLRTLQAPNPAALIVFRTLVKTQELACDALAASVTKRPAALASALLKFRHGYARPHPDGDHLGAIEEILRRGDVALTRARVRALLDAPPSSTTPRLVTIGAAMLLGGLLWLIA